MIRQFIKRFLSSFIPEIPFLNIYPREVKIFIHAKTSTQMFIGAAFIIASKWKQYKCVSVEWMNKCGISIDNEILFGNKKEKCTDTYYSMDET